MRSKASLAFFLAKAASFTRRSASTLAAAAAFWMDVAAIRAAAKSALAKSRSMAPLGVGSKKAKLGLEQGGQRKEEDETAQERWAMEEQRWQMRRSEGAGSGNDSLSNTTKQSGQKSEGWFFRTQSVHIRR